MAEQADPAANGSRIADQVGAEHLGLAGRHPQQAGAGAQQAGLAGPVGSLEQHDLAPGHVEVDAGEDREPANQGDSGAEADDGVHDATATVARPGRHCHPGRHDRF